MFKLTAYIEKDPESKKLLPEFVGIQQIEVSG